MFSYWEKTAYLESDLVIIGGGIVGLSVAASVLEQYQGVRVLVLERSTLPSGASLRNAGFACFGSLTEVLADIRSMGFQASVDLLLTRYNGLKTTRSRLGDHAIGYMPVGGYELLPARQEEAWASMDTLNEQLREYFALYVYRDATDQLESMGFSTKAIRYMVHNPLEGYLHSGSLLRSLQRYVVQKGGVLLHGAEVVSHTPAGAGNGVEVRTTVDGKEVRLRPAACVVCTNGFAGTMNPELQVMPGRGQVLVTKPLDRVPFKGTFHMDEGYLYFRDLDDRVLIGGGRNRDIEKETTTEEGTNESIVAYLKDMLENVVLPGQSFELEYSWSGIMGFGQDKQPIVKKIAPATYAAVRMSGMGVAIAGSIGEQVADMLAEQLAG